MPNLKNTEGCPSPRSALLLFVLLSITYGYFYRAGDANQNSRLDLTRALAEDHTFAINRYADNTPDMARLPILSRDLGKHPGLDSLAVSNKSPGTSFLGVPIWKISRTFFNKLGCEPWVAITWAHYFTTWLTVGIPSALGLTLFYLWLGQVSQRPYSAMMVTLGLGIGSPFFPYATAFYSHPLAAVTLFFAFYASWLLKYEENKTKTNIAWSIAGGFAAGYSVVLEYPAAIPAMIIFGYALIVVKKKLWIWLALLSALAAGFILIIYNLVVSHHVLFITYMHIEPVQQSYQVHLAGLKKFSMPSLFPVFQILFGHERGLLYACPWIALCFFGWGAMLCRETLRKEAILFMTIALAMIGFYAFTNSQSPIKAYVLWRAGHTIGPRHLICSLLFMVAGIVFLPKWVRLLCIPLMIWSIITMTAVVAVNPYTDPETVKDPVYQYALPKFFQGNFPLNGVTKTAFTDRSLVGDITSWNVGQLLGLKGRWSVAPLLAFWTIYGGWAFFTIRQRERLLR